MNEIKRCLSVGTDGCSEYQCQKQEGHRGQHEWAVRWITKNQVRRESESDIGG